MIGANWVEDERLNPFDLATGHAPRRADEAIIDQSTFDSEHHTLGDTITVLGKGEPRQLTLVGTATFGDAGGLPGVTLVGLDRRHRPGAVRRARRLRQRPRRRPTDRSQPTSWPTRIAAELGGPDTYEVVTGAADTADSKADLEKSLGFFNTFLLAFAYIALFVGMFIIYNTFSIVVAQRARDMAMLRAIGASRGQVVRSVVFESVAVGVVASAAGLGRRRAVVVRPAGTAQRCRPGGAQRPHRDRPSTVILAFVVGTAITVLVGPVAGGAVEPGETDRRPPRRRHRRVRRRRRSAP